MTINEYQERARRTQRKTMSNKEKLQHAVFGLSAEAGEVAGILQKEYQGHRFDTEHMIKELGDCLWMLSEACDAIGVTMEQVMRINILKLMERYPDGFEEDRSLHWKDGDI